MRWGWVFRKVHDSSQKVRSWRNGVWGGVLDSRALHIFLEGGRYVFVSQPETQRKKHTERESLRQRELLPQVKPVAKIYILTFCWQGIIPRNPEWEKKAEWDSEEGGRRITRSPWPGWPQLHRGTADCFVWWDGFWRPSTSRVHGRGRKDKPFTRCFFPVLSLSCVCRMM